MAGLRSAGSRVAWVTGVILSLLTVLPAHAEDPPSWPVVSTEPGQVLYVPSGSFGTATAAAALHGNVTIIYDDPASDDPYIAVPVKGPWVPDRSYGVMNWITWGGATIHVPTGSTIQAGSNYAGAFIDAQTRHSSFTGNPTKFINDGIISFYKDNVEILALHGFDFRNNGTIEIGNIILQNVDDPSGDVLFRNIFFCSTWACHSVPREQTHMKGTSFCTISGRGLSSKVKTSCWIFLAQDASRS